MVPFLTGILPLKIHFFQEVFLGKQLKKNDDFQSYSNINKLFWLINNKWRAVVNILIAAWQTRRCVLFSVK